MTELDQVQLIFSPASLAFINWMLGIIMFGVALDLRLADFANVLKAPKAPLVGLCSQFLLVPLVASALVYLMQPPPSVGLGIMLVAACPGGNVSNYLTNLSGGNTALSVSMSAISTLSAIVMTPFNFLFWGRLNPVTQDLIQEISITPQDLLSAVFIILLLPTVLGMLFAAHAPNVAAKILKPIRAFSLLVMVAFVAGALYTNWTVFTEYVGSSILLVILVNGCALAVGYWGAKLIRVSPADARAVSFETGIQNSGFGLVLVFQFFGGLGGMAIVTAWWGIWHLLSGVALALWWSRQPVSSK